MKALIEVGPTHAEVHPRDGDEKPAHEPRQHRADGEPDHRVAVDINSHQLCRGPVLRQCAQRAPDLGVLHERDEHDNRKDRQYADQDAVIGHDQPKIPVEHAVDNFRHTALFFAEQQQDHGIEEERQPGGQQHRAFLARGSLDHGAKEEFFYQRAQNGQCDARHHQCYHERPAQLPVKRIGDEPAQNIHLPVSEVQHVHQREDQGQPESDHRILRTQIDPVGDDLFHAPPVAPCYPGPSLARG